MKHEVLMGMSLTELDQYARICGIDATGRDTREEKVALIEERRGRVAEVELLGKVFTVPVRKMHDKHVTDALAGNAPDEEIVRVFRELLGEDQHAEVLELCTDEDGVVDGEAYALAMARLITCEDLKNY